MTNRCGGFRGIRPLRGRRTLLGTVRGVIPGARPALSTATHSNFRPSKLAARGRGRPRAAIIFGLKKSDMAAIDYATCGANDVIAHSLKLHPELLADRLRFHARVHAQFADAYDREVTRNELDLADSMVSVR